jgi:glycosyltransferase involved in cell wall biosynthesis
MGDSMVTTAGRRCVSVLTMSEWGPAFPRVARWLGSGLREVGVAADIVFLDGPEEVVVDGSTRIVCLGARRARSALLPLRRYIAEAAPDVVLALPDTIAMVAVVAARTTGRPVVPWVVTIPRLDRRDLALRLRPLRFLAPQLFRSCPRIAAVSAGVRGALLHDFPRHRHPDRIVVLPMPLDADEIRRMATPAASKDVLRICSVGRLAHAKGFDVLIDALAHARLPDPWEALIIGEGTLREDLVRQVHRAGLDEHVQFMGHVDNPYPLMASADIGVQPSRWDGFGVAMGEFLALGIPLLTTDCPGGFRDVMGAAGVVVPPDDSAALADAIARLAEDQALRQQVGALGPASIARYAPAAVARQIMEMVAEIVDHPRTAGRDS